MNSEGLLRIFSKIVDLIILNIVFIICSLPLFTLGASFTALYSVTLKMVRDEEAYIVSGFLGAWKANFRQATLLFIPMVCMIAFICTDYILLSQYGGLLYSVLKALTIIFGLGLLCVFLYIFPVLARFRLGIWQVVANVFGMWLFRPFYSLLLLLLSVPVMFFALYSIYTVAFLGIIGVICGFSLYAYIQSYIFRIVFAEFEK
ncbi:MAG: YesL family protein [Lachnospiraceae bacterium]